jgi:hypothetical protein
MFVLATAEGQGDIRKNRSFVNDTVDSEEEAIAAMRAPHAAVVMMTVNRPKEFESALATRDMMEQANGVLMHPFSIDAVPERQLTRRWMSPSSRSGQELGRRSTGLCAPHRSGPSAALNLT